MSKKRNLALALLTIKYVKEKMTLGAFNKGEGLVVFSGACIAASRVMSAIGDSVSKTLTGREDVLASISYTARLTEGAGCGNCGEQTSTAFMYLSKQKVSPLDFMNFQNGDHAFVVIGRSSNSNELDHTTWGDEAVVCDAWHEKAYFAAEIPQQMVKGWDYFSSIYRID